METVVTPTLPPVVTPPGGVLFPILIFVVVAVFYVAGYVVSRRGGESPIEREHGPGADCTGACSAWRDRCMETCKAEQETELARVALEIARADESRAFALWLAALAVLIVVSVYHIDAWIIPAQIAVIAASAYWGITLAARSEAEARYRESAAKLADAREAESLARMEVIRHCTQEQAAACLSLRPC